MQLLLDTHVLLWALSGSARLGQDARNHIADGANSVFVSAASVWEISIKRALDKLRAPEGIIDAIDAARFEHLPINLHHAEAAGLLPGIHRDPFDRVLVAQANVELLTLVTHDRLVQQYDVRILPV